MLQRIQCSRIFDAPPFNHKSILVLILSRGWNPQQLPTPTSVRIALVVRGRRGRSGMDGWVSDDPKAPEPQLMPPSVTRWFAPQPLSGRVGGEKETWAEP